MVCVREKGDAIFDLVPLDEGLRWSLCWSSREAAAHRGRHRVGGLVRVRAMVESVQSPGTSVDLE